MVFTKIVLLQNMCILILQHIFSLVETFSTGAGGSVWYQEILTTISEQNLITFLLVLALKKLVSLLKY